MSGQKLVTKKATFREEVAIPQGVQVNISGFDISAKGPKGELKRNFLYPGITVKKEGEKMIVASTTANRKEKAIVNTYVAHLNNMFRGVTTGFKYKMKIVFSHFPVTVKVVGKEVEITNYFGEKKARKAKIIGNAKVTAGKEEITIEGVDVEEVGQTMSNLEQVTRIRYKDTRIFQDGIYLTSREA